MIGSNFALSASSSGSPSAGAHVAFSAARTGAMRCAMSSMYAALSEKILSTSASGIGCVSVSSPPFRSAVDPGIIRMPPSLPWIRICSRNTIWSGKMLPSSPRSSLR